jgi:hypothetical protein
MSISVEGKEVVKADNHVVVRVSIELTLVRKRVPELALADVVVVLHRLDLRLRDVWR